MLKATTSNANRLADLSVRARRAELARHHGLDEIRDAINGLRGRYEVSKLGSGGCAVVLGLHCRDSGDRFAVKKSLKPEEKFRATIRREARIGMMLPNHPGLVRFFGHTEEGIEPLVAMEALDGVRLNMLFKAGTLDEYLNILAIVADSIVAAHNRGIVHKDLKTENVVNTKEGPITIDFGLAAEIGEIPSTVGGTQEMVPPEAFRLKEIAPSRDVYALGRMLDDRLRGSELTLPPMTIMSAQKVIDFNKERPPIPQINQRNEGIPMSLVLVAALAMHPDPQERITATEFRDALRGYLGQN